MREIIEDEGLRRLTGMERIPSTSTIDDWIRRQGNGRGLSEMKSAINELNRKVLKLHSHCTRPISFPLVRTPFYCTSFAHYGGGSQGERSSHLCTNSEYTLFSDPT